MGLSLTTICLCAECHYDECRDLFFVMLNVIMMSVAMLNVIVLSVVVANQLQFLPRGGQFQYNFGVKTEQFLHR
jgi:hypothetical protein